MRSIEVVVGPYLGEHTQALILPGVFMYGQRAPIQEPGVRRPIDGPESWLHPSFGRSLFTRARWRADSRAITEEGYPAESMDDSGWK